ncbi:DUF2637 domain-containing protein [Streptomyces halstedii]|uniref:DUF2637 domain-containing protein n=1 Tax=Streptomyces halstedii TaxID=1944 RepID=UPI0037F8ACCA
MSDTLTGDQDTAYRGAMAPAAPDTASAAPGTRSAAPGAVEAAPPAPRTGGRTRPGEADTPMSAAPAADPPASAESGRPRPPAPGSKWVNRLLLALALVGMPLVGIIGFASSYTTLRGVAADNGFGDNGIWSLAPWVPIGIDASIVAFLAMDLVMVMRRTPWPVLRFAAHAMTLVTVAFNASDGLGEHKDGIWAALWADPVRTGLHAVMPVLFVIGIEAARHLLIKAADLEDGITSDRIPLHRWVLSPLATPRLYRRMRLAAVRSYPQMVAREQSLAGYEVWLRQKHGGDLSKASETERLPMKMAPRGYTVEEALRLPEKWEADAQERQREEAERKRRKAEDERAQAERQRQQAKADRIAAIDDEGDVIEAKHRKEARTGTAAALAEAAKVEAEFQKKAAERRALAELNAEESAEAAALRLKAADDNEKAAQAELRAAQIHAEAAQKAAEAERREQETEDRAARRIKEHQRQVEAEQKTAEAELHIARLKEQTASLEAAAQRSEDYARLSPRERNERRVARMIQAAGGDVDAVPLKDIMEELSIKQTAAGEVRAAAVELLKNGYQPDQILDSAQH